MDDNINPQPGGTAALVLMEAELDQLQLLQKSFPNCYCNASLCGTNHQLLTIAIQEFSKTEKILQEKKNHFPPSTEQ